MILRSLYIYGAELQEVAVTVEHRNGYDHTLFRLSEKHKTSVLMKKLRKFPAKEVIVITIIILFALFTAFIINFLLSHDIPVIPTIFSKSEWFGFWTTYITGVFAVIIGYFSISVANRNSNRAILHQNAILIQQKSDAIYNEVIQAVKEHNKLFNIIRLTSSILTVNDVNIEKAKSEVFETRSKIHETNLGWSMLKTIYLSSVDIKAHVEKYDKDLSEVLELLDEYAKLELDLLRLFDGFEYDHNQVAPLVRQIQGAIASLRSKQDSFFQASMEFLSGLSSYTFVRPEMANQKTEM